MSRRNWVVRKGLGPPRPSADYPANEGGGGVEGKVPYSLARFPFVYISVYRGLIRYWRMKKSARKGRIKRHPISIHIVSRASSFPRQTNLASSARFYYFSPEINNSRPSFKSPLSQNIRARNSNWSKHLNTFRRNELISRVLKVSAWDQQ